MARKPNQEPLFLVLNSTRQRESGQIYLKVRPKAPSKLLAFCSSLKTLNSSNEQWFWRKIRLHNETKNFLLANHLIMIDFFKFPSILPRFLGQPTTIFLPLISAINFQIFSGGSFRWFTPDWQLPRNKGLCNNLRPLLRNIARTSSKMKKWPIKELNCALPISQTLPLFSIALVPFGYNLKGVKRDWAQFNAMELPPILS